MSETRSCPKCGSNMQGDKALQFLGSETELASKNGFLGDKVRVFYCEKCGFIELAVNRRNYDKREHCAGLVFIVLRLRRTLQPKFPAAEVA